MIIFGQDPYPRETSATGIAFFDGEFTEWDQALSKAPSFRNIIKSALVASGKLPATAKILELKAAIQANKIVEPSMWFNSTIKNGVLWLNTALTFSGKEKACLDAHTKFWAPIISFIIQIILCVQAKAPQQKGLVFVMWGGNAKKLKPIVSFF